MDLDLVTKQFISIPIVYDAPGNLVEPTFNSNFVHFSMALGKIFEFDKQNDTLKIVTPTLPVPIGWLFGSHIVSDSYIAGVTSEGIYTELYFNGDKRKE